MNIQPTSTLGEIAAQSLQAVRAFEKAGIDYCCGGRKSIQQACSEKGIPWEPLAAAIQAETAADTANDATRDWHREPMSALIRHILSTHHEYLKSELPRLSGELGRVQKAHPKHADIIAPLMEVYTALFAELDPHMAKEERVLFPHIERMEAAADSGQPFARPPFATFRNPIGMMESEHETAGQCLAEIRRLTADFTPPPDACATWRALYAGLAELEKDLHRHIHLENNILFPRALVLETRMAEELAAR